MMQVNLSTIDSFIQELEAEAAIENKIVRCDIQTEDKSNGVKYVFLKAGFRSNGELRILSLHCGESPCGRNDVDGTEVAMSCMEEIMAITEKKQLNFRRGAFMA